MRALRLSKSKGRQRSKKRCSRARRRVSGCRRRARGPRPTPPRSRVCLRAKVNLRLRSHFLWNEHVVHPDQDTEVIGGHAEKSKKVRMCSGGLALAMTAHVPDRATWTCDDSAMNELVTYLLVCILRITGVNDGNGALSWPYLSWGRCLNIPTRRYD